MNRRRMTFFVVAALVPLVDSSDLQAGQIPDLANVVAQHYPQLLVQRAVEINGLEPPRNQCFGVLESSPSGAPQIVVAGYTNMTRGAIRLLRNTSAGFEVAAEPSAGYSTGWECEVEAIDVNNDGRKEAVVHFLTRNASVDWVFDWDGQQLRSLSPTTTDDFGLIRTQFLNTSFVDIDGDNVMKAFTDTEPPQDGQPEPSELYRLSGTSSCSTDAWLACALLNAHLERLKRKLQRFCSQSALSAH